MARYKFYIVLYCIEAFALVVSDYSHSRLHVKCQSDSAKNRPHLVLTYDIFSPACDPKSEIHRAQIQTVRGQSFHRPEKPLQHYR